MAIGEFVSVCTQRDIETAQMKRAIETKTSLSAIDEQDEEEKKERLPNPGQAALASALAFSVGAAMPLLAAVFIENHKVRMAVVAIVATLALLVFGVTGAVLERQVCSSQALGWSLVAGWLWLLPLVLPSSLVPKPCKSRHSFGDHLVFMHLN
ncbi:Vacuolar iron transporter-like protein 2.1 [Raphanus sativus]|nr:Vacuolar iron transporter-like protein 2.1 [Raphanus sativus]